MSVFQWIVDFCGFFVSILPPNGKGCYEEIPASKGDYFSLLNADESFLPKMIYGLIKHLRRTTEYRYFQNRHSEEETSYIWEVSDLTSFYPCWIVSCNLWGTDATLAEQAILGLYFLRIKIYMSPTKWSLACICIMGGTASINVFI